MHILVRKATSADLESLLRFEQGVVQAERPFDPTLKEGTIHYHDISTMLTSDEVEFVVAIAGQRPVGCGFARIEPAEPFFKHACHAYVGLMYVEPEYRGKGVNGRILDVLKDWCRSRHVAEMRLEVYHGNEPAVRAYEKAGFAPLYSHMRLQLPDE